MNKFVGKILCSFYKKLQKAYQKQNYYNYRKKFSGINPNFVFNGEEIKIYGNGEISLGENSYIGSYSTIQLTDGTKVSIGNNTAISHNVRIYTSNRNPMDIIQKKDSVEIEKGDVIIGEHCWIGANVFICHGIIIGDYSVIGANSVVSKNIPSNSIAAGAPIRILKSKC